MGERGSKSNWGLFCSNVPANQFVLSFDSGVLSVWNVKAIRRLANKKQNISKSGQYVALYHCQSPGRRFFLAVKRLVERLIGPS